MSLLEQDHQEGAGVRERYEIYEIYEEGMYEVRDRWKVSNTLSRPVSHYTRQMEGIQYLIPTSLSSTTFDPQWLDLR